MINFSWKVFLSAPAKLIHLGFVCFGVGFHCCFVDFPFDLPAHENKAFYSLNTLLAKVLTAVIKNPKWRTISLALKDLENFGATVNVSCNQTTSGLSYHEGHNTPFSSGR